MILHISTEQRVAQCCLVQFRFLHKIP